MLLRGRCHDCGQPIAFRYPLVEFLVALASGVILLSSLVPEMTELGPAYRVNLLLVGVRLALVYLMFCVALLDFDGNRLPLRLLSLAIVLAAIAASQWQPARPLLPGDLKLGDLAVQADANAGALLVLLSWPLLLPAVSRRGLLDAASRAAVVLLVCLALGMVATTCIVMLTAAMMLGAALAARLVTTPRRLNWSVALLVATVLGIVVLVPLAGERSVLLQVQAMFEQVSSWQGLIVGGLILALLSSLARLVARNEAA